MREGYDETFEGHRGGTGKTMSKRSCNYFAYLRSEISLTPPRRFDARTLGITAIDDTTSDTVTKPKPPPAFP